MGSMFPLILPLLSSFLLAKCAPNVSPVRQLFPRANPCERSGTPVLYHDYGPDVCPGKYQLNPDGKTCPMNLEDDCEVLCQTKDRFFYDQEQPAWLHGQGGSHCYGPMTCTITESGTWTWTYSGSLSVTATIAKVLAIGASGGFSNAAANMLLASDSVTLKENECGYFTFLPLLEETCGVATLGEPTENSTTKGCGYDITEDHCVTRSSYVPDGKSIKGATIFVKIDCSNNQRLPMDQQNPAYNHEGVPAPQSVYDVWIADLPAAATPPAAENPQTTPPPIGPLEDCSLVATTNDGTIAPGPQTYCQCGSVLAGINTKTSGSMIYSVCAGDPYPTVASTTIAAPEAAPTPKCDCAGENGCTAESPACCANGSCDLDGTCATPNCD